MPKRRPREFPRAPFSLWPRTIDRARGRDYLRGMRFVVLIISLLVALPGMLLAQQRQVPQSRAEVQLSFAPLVEQVRPAVVNIYTKRIVTQRQVTPLFNDPFFRRFFGDLGGMQMGKPRREQQNSLGSGVIVRPDGMIVTNQHVIEGADKIVVVLSDKREFEATLVISDDQTDLAVLRIDPAGERLPSLSLRDSDELKVGDLVLAIGNPFGVGQTVTSGIVSALARSIGSGAELKSFIQTDAAINPGNSGGALVSMDGRLVGVNTAIFSNSGGSHGISFAIPSNMVRAVLGGLTGDGKLIRPWLGVMGQMVTPDIAHSLNMRRPVGVIVSEVHPSGSAGRAGVRPGDVILAINGHEVQSPDDMDYRIATLPVGDQAAVRIRRGSDIRPLTIDLQPAPADPPSNETELQGRNPLSGAVVANMSPAFANAHSINPFVDGVVILKMRRASTADRLNFRPGDLVRVINGRDIRRVADVQAAITNVEASEWRVRIERAGKSLDLVFRG